MDNLTLSKIKEGIEKYNSIGIVTPNNPSVDAMAGALSLYLSLKTLGKNLSIATPSQPLVEVSSLVGINEVKTSLGAPSGDLVVSFPYKEGEIEKVSYTRDDNLLNIVVKAGENGLNFNEKDVKFTRGSTAPEFLFIVGASRVSDLGQLFDPASLKDTVVVNIDNSPENQGFGDIVMVSNRFSSVSESIADLITALNFKIDLDIAQNLMLGIAVATDNFQNPSTSPLAFEMAGIMLRNGALRPTNQAQRRKLSMGFEEKGQPASQVERGGLGEALQAEEKPIVSEIPMDDPTIQSVEHKESVNPQNPPEDWLEPKIYKGSTNF